MLNSPVLRGPILNPGKCRKAFAANLPFPEQFAAGYRSEIHLGQVPSSKAPGIVPASKGSAAKPFRTGQPDPGIGIFGDGALSYLLLFVR